MNINFLTFEGLFPKIEPRLLGNNQAQIAEDFTLLGGILRSVKEPALIKELASADQISLFPYNNDWLTWSTDVDVVLGPLIDDTLDRIYYTGDGVPKVRGIDGGEQEYDLGIPKPTQILTVVSQAKGDIDWTPTWFYQYEDPANGNVTVGPTAISVTETTPGKLYTVAIPTGVGEGPNDVFILYFNGADDGSGSNLGRLYPEISFYTANSDFFLQGAEGIGRQLNNAGTATFEIGYDTSRAADYKVTRLYRYSFVSGWGEEGPLSDPSAAVDIDPTQDAALSNIQDTVSGIRNVTEVNIYRTQTTDAGEFYFLVKTIAFGTTSTVDSTPVEDIGVQAPLVDYDPPAEDLAGIVALPGRFLAAFVGKTVYLTEPDHPHAWPLEYALTVEYDVVGLGVNSSGLVVLTKGKHEIMLGEHPNAMSQVKLDTRQACTSKRGIAITGETSQAVVLFPSPDGLVSVQGGIATLITKPFYEKEQWTLLVPTSIIGEVHDGKYYGFADGGNIVFDVDEGVRSLTTTAEETTGLHSDLETDTLYMIQGSNINAWDSGADNLTGSWQSRDIVVSKPVAPSVIRVRAESYDADQVEVFLYGDGNLYYSTQVRTEKAFRTKSIPVARKWSVKVSGNVDIYEVLLSNSMQDL